VRIERAPSGSLAERLGLQPGDVIRSVNGQRIQNEDDVRRLYEQFNQTRRPPGSFSRDGATTRRFACATRCNHEPASSDPLARALDSRARARVCTCCATVPAAAEPVTLNFVNAEIDAVAKAIAQLTGRNFLLDPRVKGTINIVSSSPCRASRSTRCSSRRCACTASRRSSPAA
jgi:hypothetical protein